MPDRTQDLTNHRQVAVACKNYTDKEIKASEERILSIVARNNVSYIDHINEATYRFTAPLNSKLLTLQSIAGNSNKIAPSTPSDDSVARLKVIPENTYKSQIDYIGGKTVKYNQFLINNESTVTRNGITFTNNGNGTWTVNGTSTARANTAVNLATFKIPVKLNDKIFIIGCPSGGSVSTYYLAPVFYNDGSYVTFDINNTDVGNGKIVTVTNSNVNEVRIEIIGAQDADQTVNNLLFKPELINLTDKFGAGNEPSDVETAIPLLKANGYKLDGTDEYSTGKLKHAVVSGVKYEAVNIFDISKVLINNIVSISGNTITKQATGYNYDLFTATTSLGASVNDLSKIMYLKAGTYTINYSFVGDNSKINVCFINSDGTYNSSVEKIPNQSFTITSDTYVTLRCATNQLAKYSDLMLVSGSTTPSTYIPYAQPKLLPIPSEVLADNRYGLGFDNTNYNHLDIDGHLRGNYNTRTYTSSDVESVVNVYTKIVYFQFRKPQDFKYYDTAQSLGYINSKYDIDNAISNWDDVSKIGKIFAGANYYYFWVGFPIGTTLAQAQAQIDGLKIVYELNNSFDQDYSQYFTPNWNKVDLDKQYATCEMVVAEPIDMPNKVEYYGTIIHSLATAVKYESFNVLDEEFELGGINTNGQPESASNRIRSKNYFAIIGGLQYYLNGNNKEVHKYFYDENYNFISGVFITANGLFTPPSNASYMKIVIWLDTTYHNDICINISNQDLNGTYKPHKAPITRLLPNSEAKYSWGITDGARNTRVFCDDECNPVNEGQLDVGNQDLGLLTWTAHGTGEHDRAISSAITNAKPNMTTNAKPNILCSKYTAGTPDKSYSHSSDNLITLVSQQVAVYSSTLVGMTATQVKEALSGEPLWYQKNATDTETLDDFDFSFDCEEGDTFTIIGCELLQCYATYSFLIKEAKSNE